MSHPEPQVLVHQQCRLGENPLWDERRKSLFWVDILEKVIYRYETATKETRVIYQGGPAVGGFTIQEDGILLLFRENDIAVLQENGDVDSIITVEDEGMRRFNDVIADPEGRVFAGTIGCDESSGGLYRLDTDGRMTKILCETRVANGMGFSPDLGTFYWTCSTRKKVFRFSYDRASGEISNRKTIITAEEGEGTPDGLTVDADGNLWSARWGGYAVCKHTPDGVVIEKIHLPVEKVSSIVFGGDEFNRLFITTAGDPSDEGLDGDIFHLPCEVKGRPEFRSRIYPSI